MISAIRKIFGRKGKVGGPKPAREAYNTWSASYDAQPGNLMLDLDAIVFDELINNIELLNKVIVDVGCGTGRHWNRLYAGSPALLKGYDVSEGMLAQLQVKFPQAHVVNSTDNLLSPEPDSSVDCIISTLTIAHIEHMPDAVASWARVLKPGGDMIITDFHPKLLGNGGSRTFKDGNKQVTVVNYVHPVEEVIRVASAFGCRLIDKKERIIDDTVKAYYTNQGAESIFYKFKGMPVIYGLHLKKGNDPE